MKFLFRHLSIIALLCPLFLSGQELNNFRIRTIQIGPDTLKIDTLSLIPGSVTISSTENQDLFNCFYIDYPGARISLLQNDCKLNDSNAITIRYRVFPFDLSRKYFHKDESWLSTPTLEPVNPFMYRTTETKTDILNLNELSKSGSISRGISFGNNQDVVVNSNFNLQLSGRLSDEINVVAAITDNNIPIQPEGNTQQIQEFDKVFIQLSAKKHLLTVGDYDLPSPKNHFLHFFKKAQGVDYSTEFHAGRQESNLMRVKTSAALSKGKFARNNIQGIEGNQGPYKLKGNEGETFLIVLAGSEKVYIDGKLMRRGDVYDYTINYNTGEITFTPNVLITKDKRIVVEFEYSDKNYARALFFVNNEFSSDKFTYRINAYSESDLKNQSLQQDLTAEQKQLLKNIGDSIQDALIWNIDSVGFSQDEVRYLMTDTLVNGINYDSVLVFSINSQKAIYKAGFSLVGSGRGNYLLVSSDANGRVFKWVAPLNGIPQGNYDPVRLLVTPKKKQMLTFGADAVLPGKIMLNTELAVSNHDINTFSNNDRKNNTGFAMLTGLNKIWKPGRQDSSGWTLATGIFYEYTGKNFNPVEPYRPVEFNRDWNIQSLKPETEHYSGLKISATGNTGNFLNYELKGLWREKNYSGIMNRLNGVAETRNILAAIDGSYLNTRNIGITSDFIRNKAELAWKFKKFRIGLRDDQEYNVFRISDSLRPDSYAYFEWGAFLKSQDTSNLSYELFYNRRTDQSVRKNILEKSSLSNEAGFSLRLYRNPNNRLKISGRYRELILEDSTNTGIEPENTIVGRIEHNLRIKKGFLSFNTFYEVGSGLEEKKEFSYLKVPPGEGIYTWIDYNGDGIQQLNEFEVAPFKDEATYIRIYSPSNEFVKAYYNQFSETILLNPAAIWINQKGLKKFLARFSNQLAYRIEHKTSENEPNKAYNPFVSRKNFEDSTLLTLISSFRNTVYFNRINPDFGLDYNFMTNRNKSLLVNGFESKTQIQHSVNLRWNFYQDLSLFLNGVKGIRTNTSEYFPAKDYSINNSLISPKISYQPGTTLRIDIKYRYEFKQNTQSPERETTRIHDAGIELNYKIVNQATLLITANYLDITYTALAGTALAFEMLNGFQPGKNGVWSIGYQQNIAQHLQLNLIYEGRKSPGSGTVHIGSAQLRAYF
ncbi:MAG: hypothetical protein KKA81_14360 [Bacteroidetes bacterium]|nr:hypothetical protein [Bacteroidota bacterium]